MNVDKLWYITMILIGLITLTLFALRMFGIEVPDMAKRIIGILEIIAIPVLAYTTIKRTRR